ncbi:uncharacterized protein LOC118196149 isoform X2 [Stegodyphus dumicola]|uniref:uncharacterized protein LOC118196149 isoform X2 n=1 Tax=Stegodyphus dumicola TaxID=202533 RepID=UPI0015ACF3D1|nr:uncharacterized protein LOC118196149 isoform X2 [Stegodyphus dumicola]
MDVTYMSFLNSIYFLTFCFLCVSSDDTNLVPIGLGLTSLKYASPDGNRLSFNPNENVEIYVKDVGPKKDLWGVMLNGEKGYISKGFIKETKSFVKKLVSAEVDFKNSHTSDSSSAVTGQAHLNKETQSMYGTQLKASVNDFSLHTSGNSYSSDFSSVQNSFNTAPESLSSDMDTDMDFFIESEDETVAGNNFPSSSHVHFTSDNILPSSSSHRPNIKQTAFHSQDILQSPYLQNTYDSESLQYDRSILQNEDSFYNSDIQSNTFFSSHIASENINPDSSKISDTVQYSQQKTEFFDPEQISYDSPESTWSDSDLSETLSILKNRGVYDSDIYAEQYSESVSSYPSQNVHADQQSKHADFNYVKPLSSHVLHATVTEQQIKTHLPLHDPSDIQPSEMNYGGESFSHIHSSLHENEFKSVSDKTLSSDNNVYKEKLSNVQNEIFQKNKQVKGALEKSRINKNVVSKNNKEINSKTERFSEEKTLKIEENLKPSEKLTVLKTSDIEILSSRNPQTDDTILNSIFEDSEEEEMTTIVIKPRKTSNPTYMAKTDIHVSQHIQKEDNQAEVKQIVESSMSQSDTDDIIIDDDSKEEVFLNSGIGSNLVVKHTSKSDLDHNVTVNNLDEEKSQEQYFEKSVYTSTVNEIAHNINGSVKTVYNEMPIDDIDSLTDSKDMHNDILIKTEDKDTLSDILIETEDKDTLSDILMETEDKDTLSDILIETEDKDFISTESIDETKTENNETNFPIENDAEVNDVLTSPNLNGSDESPNSFQVRNLKGEHLAQEDQNSDSRVENEENVTQSEFNIYITFENGLNALRSFMEALMLWIPEPLYSAIMDLDRKGIPPRVTVFTALSAIPCIFLIIAMVYIKVG